MKEKKNRQKFEHNPPRPSHLPKNHKDSCNTSWYECKFGFRAAINSIPVCVIEMAEGTSACKKKTTTCGRPPKHATSSETRDHELKITVEGVSALKGSISNRSLDLNPTCCIVVPHCLLA